MQAATPEKLLEAFKVLDKDNKGFLDRAYLTKLVTQECEPLIQVLMLSYFFCCFKNV